IFRRRWRLFAITLAATIATSAIYSVTVPRQYRPQATLEIRPETPLVTSDREDPTILATRNLWENYYRTQESILTSASLHAQTLRELPEATRREYEAKLDPVAAFSKKVDIEKVRSSFILKIGFIDTDAQKATQIVNTLVSLYMDEANRHLRELKTGAAQVLSKETLPAIRQNVDDAEKALRQFQAEGGFIDPQEQYSTFAGARRMVFDRITQIRLKQMQVRAELESLQTYRADGASGVFNPFFSTKALELLVGQQEVLESDLVRERRELKEEHPTILELEDQLKRVHSKIILAIRETLKSLENDLAAADLEARLANDEQIRIEKEMASLSQRVSQHKRLEAELTAARELYNSYLKKHGEEAASTGMSLGSVRVIDHATVPLKPFRPDLVLNLALGAAVGILLGVGAMFISEQLDDRIRSAREIDVFLGLEVIGVIPRLGQGAAPDHPYLLDEKSSVAEFETFRALRAELTTRMEGVPGPKVIAILSPMSGEGKSTVTVNLAKVLAMDGRKVLIFDADMRRPSMRRAIGQADGPDLEKVLLGEAEAKAVLRPSLIPGVDWIGMDKGTSHAAELAGAPRFEEVFRSIREGYDYVLVDSAPVNQASESALIARRCDRALLVLRERRTGRGAGQAARRRLEGMGIDVLGAVLNAVQSPETAYGYYGYYYSYYNYYKPRSG
ncbi:MAG TPA: polysaccharide biosynthesis tyrosine autokinase, partial [Planctomycetota bacterium]|nr:polysaccharide biosynthesis tyrosine autokinase [Planctomycetota bacterium]